MQFAAADEQFALERAAKCWIVTGDEQGRPAIAAGLADKLYCREGVFGVEAGGGFIGQYEHGVAGDGAGDGDALLLADAEGVDLGLRAVDAEIMQQLCGPRPMFGTGDGAEHEGGHDVLGGGETGEELEGLEDHADVGASECIALALGEGVKVLAGDDYRAGAWGEEPGDDGEEGAFSAAAAAAEEELLTGLNGQ